MAIKNKIIDDLKAAMKAKDPERLSTLRMVKAALMNREIELGKEIPDEEAQKSLTTLLKQRRDSAGQYRDAGRSELAEKEEREAAIIEEYLPKSATDDEIAKAVEEAVAETGAESMKDMGAVMKSVLAALSDRTVDGKKVSEIVRNRLS